MGKRLQSQHQARQRRRIKRALRVKLGLPRSKHNRRVSLPTSSRVAIKVPVYKLVLTTGPEDFFGSSGWRISIMQVFGKSGLEASDILSSVNLGKEVVLASAPSKEELIELRRKLLWSLREATKIRESNDL